jgi:hypothetical protein
LSSGEPCRKRERKATGEEGRRSRRAIEERGRERRRRGDRPSWEKVSWRARKKAWLESPLSVLRTTPPLGRLCTIKLTASSTGVSDEERAKEKGGKQEVIALQKG